MRFLTDYEDGLEMLMEERIDQVLNECKRSRKNYARKEEEYLSQLKEPVREMVEKLLELNLLNFLKLLENN